MFNKRIIRDGVWVAAGRISAAIALLIGTRLLTEYVSPSTFGSLSLLTNIALLSSGVFCGPIFQAILKYYHDVELEGGIASFRKLVGKILVKRLFFSLAILFFIGALYCIIEQVVVLPFVLLAVLIIVETFRTKEQCFLNAARKQKQYAIWAGAESWARPLLAIVLVNSFGAKVEFLLLGYVCATLAVMVIGEYLLRTDASTEEPVKIADHPVLRKQIVKFAAPLLPLAVVAWVTGVSDRYFIGTIIGLKSVGFYAAAYGIGSQPFLLVGNMLELTLRPIFYKAVTARDKKRERKIFRAWILATIVLCAIGVLIILFAKYLITSIFLAKDYGVSAELLPWIAAGYFLLVLSKVYEMPCYAYNKTGYIFKIELIGAVVSIAASIPMIYRYGIMGAAMAVPVYCGIQLIAAMYVSRKIFNEMTA